MVQYDIQQNKYCHSKICFMYILQFEVCCVVCQQRTELNFISKIYLKIWLLCMMCLLEFGTKFLFWATSLKSLGTPCCKIITLIP